jgi:hypothetical protein
MGRAFEETEEWVETEEERTSSLGVASMSNGSGMSREARRGERALDKEDGISMSRDPASPPVELLSDFC